MTGRVVVVGAVNMDLLVHVARLPGPGETVLGGHLARHPGGKGANQAVAAARVGAQAALICRVADDPEGRDGVAALAAEGVHLPIPLGATQPSGVAMIAVAPGGANQIVVAPGANLDLDSSDVERAFALLAPAPGDVLLASLEVPLETVGTAVMAALGREMSVVLNPAPATSLPASILEARPILTPNRSELHRLSGSDDLETGAARFMDAGAAAVIVTLGADGAAVFDGEGRTDLPAIRVEAVDSTGAGDCFNGVLAAELARGRPVRAAAVAANVAAGLSVRAPGARGAMPTRLQLDEALAPR